MERYMFIELLWVIPIVGFGIFISILVFLLHNKFSMDADRDLKREVMDFNAGVHHAAAPASHESAAELERRLSELEGALSSLTQSIAAHQKSMAEYSAAGKADNPELGRMLEAMRREYDAILHENRTLRTQFMQFLSEDGRTPKVAAQPKTKTDLKIFDDTRSLSAADLEDTSTFETILPTPVQSAST